MDNWKVFICVILRTIWDNCEIGSPGPPLFRPGYNLVNVIVFFNFATRRRKFRFHYLASSSEECPLAAGTCSGATEILSALQHVVGTLSLSQASRALATNLHPFLLRVPPPCLLGTVPHTRLERLTLQHIDLCQTGAVTMASLGAKAAQPVGQLVPTTGTRLEESVESSGILLTINLFLTLCAPELPWTKPSISMFNILQFFPKYILLEPSKLLACAASCSRELHSGTIKGVRKSLLLSFLNLMLKHFLGSP